MTTILGSDLFRNFLGGFIVGAIALFALQPDDARARMPADDAISESKLTR